MLSARCSLDAGNRGRHRGALPGKACLSFVCCQVMFLLALSSAAPAEAQCSGNVSTPQSAADCAARFVPLKKTTALDPSHAYSLAELIDIAEHNNPKTQVAWERAKQKAASLGIARSAYYPVLAGVAAFADERTILPATKTVVPPGFVETEVAELLPELELQYLIFDFGGREAKVDAATQQKLAAGASFIQANQTVAFQVSSDYYKLVTAQERLKAAQETLKTAQITEDAAENQLNNGRSTLPDVLNARAETSQAMFDLESADGDEKIARVTLAEAIGVEPSPDIVIDAQQNAPLPESLTLPVNDLVARAIADRPDLAGQVAEIRAADAEVRAARAEYRPRIVLSGSGGESWLYSTSNLGPIDNLHVPVWSASVGLEWRIFDGGARKNNEILARSRRREADDEMVELRDSAAREVWTAYIAFQTALRQHEAAVALLASANASYAASLDAYKYGVKNLIDVVTAEKQLAQARLSSVSARSKLLLEAVDLEFVTGNLLRAQKPATTPNERGQDNSK